MATITLRNTKGSPLTNAEIDGNFTNLNNAKLETNGSGANLTNLNASNITTGTLAVARGGTGQNVYANGQLLIGNSTGNTLTKANLTPGSNISITNGTGTITIATSAIPVFTTVTTTGNVTIAGDLAVNGSDITTNALGTATVFNANAQTLNIGGSATAVNIGAATGTLTVNNTTLAAKAITASTTLNVTGVSTFAAGTALLPSISRTGDTNTGMFFPAADTIAFTEGGVEAMRIDSSGRVGIGLTSVFGQLDIQAWGAGLANGLIVRNSTGSGAQLLLTAQDSSSVNISASTSSTNPVDMKFYTTAAEGGGIQQRAIITSDGNVGIGTGSPQARLDVNGGVIIGGTLSTNGAVTLNSTLGVTGLATIGSVRSTGVVTQVIHKRVDTKVTYAIPGYVAGTTANGVFIAALDTTITPKFSTSKVLVNMCISFEVHNDTIFKLYRVVGGVSTEIGRNSTDAQNWSGIWHPGYDFDNNSTPTTNTYFFYDTPNTASAVTYRLMCQSSGIGATTFFLNRTVNSAGSATFGEVAISQVLLQEIC
jgi:hypothetical protein